VIILLSVVDQAVVQVLAVLTMVMEVPLVSLDRDRGHYLQVRTQ
jgi:hypothetical protein